MYYILLLLFFFHFASSMVLVRSMSEERREGVFSFRWDILHVSISSLEGVPGWALRQSSWMSEKLSKDAEITKSY